MLVPQCHSWPSNSLLIRLSEFAFRSFLARATCFCLTDLFDHYKFQVSGRITELKTTIDAGSYHRDNLLRTIGDQFEQWNLKVCFNYITS